MYHYHHPLFTFHIFKLNISIISQFHSTWSNHSINFPFFVIQRIHCLFINRLLNLFLLNDSFLICDILLLSISYVAIFFSIVPLSVYFFLIGLPLKQILLIVSFQKIKSFTILSMGCHLRLTKILICCSLLLIDHWCWWNKRL